MAFWLFSRTTRHIVIARNFNQIDISRALCFSRGRRRRPSAPASHILLPILPTSMMPSLLRTFHAKGSKENRAHMYNQGGAWSPKQNIHICMKCAARRVCIYFFVVVVVVAVRQMAKQHDKLWTLSLSLRMGDRAPCDPVMGVDRDVLARAEKTITPSQPPDRPTVRPPSVRTHSHAAEWHRKAAGMRANVGCWPLSWGHICPCARQNDCGVHSGQNNIYNMKIYRAK